MSDSPLFKRAFVRGLNAELMRQGVVHFPSKEAADHAADYVADNFCPDPIQSGESITLKVAHTLCEQLNAAGDHLCKEAGDQYQPVLNKTAAEHDPAEYALFDAWQVMEKVAAETGSLYEGGDSANDMPHGAQHNAEAALEAKRRPENYANLGEDGQGDLARKGEGSVGTEEMHPEAPGASDSGSNSVQEYSKMSSLANIVRKVAQEGMMTPGADKNDLPAAAAHNAAAAQELARRGENYANKGEAGVGRSDMVPSAADQVGTEQPHPEAPAAPMHAGKTNVPMEHSKSAFDQLFRDTAQDMLAYLPDGMDDTSKVAHLRANMGFETEKRAEYIHAMWQQLSPTNASAIRDHYLKTAALRAKRAEEHKDEDKKKEDSDYDDLPPAMKEKMIPKGSDADGDGKTNEESLAEEMDKEASASDAQNALSFLNKKLAALQLS